jgi:hypothetical protein
MAHMFTPKDLDPRRIMMLHTLRRAPIFAGISRFGLFALLSALLIVGLFLADIRNWGGLGAYRERKWNELQEASLIWKDDGTFHSMIQKADRLKILASGSEDLGQHAGTSPVLFHTRDPNVLAEFHRSLRFAAHEQHLSQCSCSGYPIIEWSRGGKVLTRVVVHHGEMLGGEIFRSGSWIFGNSKTGNVWLAPDSSGWLVDQLVSLGVEGEYPGIAQKRAAASYRGQNDLPGGNASPTRE